MSSEMTATQKALFDVLNECYDLPYDRFEEIFPDLEKLVGPVAPAASTMLWAVRDTLSGALYPQPNKLIAERVAEMHGHCEIIEVMVSSPTTQSQDHMHELVQHRDGKPPWCNVCLRTADGRLARDIPFGAR